MYTIGEVVNGYRCDGRERDELRAVGTSRLFECLTSRSVDRLLVVLATTGYPLPQLDVRPLEHREEQSFGSATVRNNKYLKWCAHQTGRRSSAGRPRCSVSSNVMTLMRPSPSSEHRLTSAKSSTPCSRSRLRSS